VRRAALLSLIALVAGCAEEREDPAPQLRAWKISKQPFIPRVEAPPPAPEPKPKPAAGAGGSESQVADDAVSEGAPSDAEIRAQLRELYGASGGPDPAAARAIALSGGKAAAPPDAPQRVQRLVAAANHVAKLPYVYGGGHGGGPEGLFVDSAYDCSGSISFALASAGLLESPMASTGFMSWGKPGRGKWITIYANEGHAFMTVGGARFDTVGLRQSGSRWQPAFRSVSGFTARHPPGL
jgi:hypothetical protein